VSVRRDAIVKAAGTAVYTSDIRLPDMLHASVVRSQVAHGVLESVDLTAALSHPGVVAGLTGRDAAALPSRRYGGWVKDQSILATDRVRFAGEPVAALVAETAAQAQRAAALVDVEITDLPVVGDWTVACLPDAIEIHPGEYDVSHAIPPSVPPRQPGEVVANVCYETAFTDGDLDGAFVRAAWVHDATYTFPAGAQVPMEPHAVVASWDGEGRLRVWTGTQEPFAVRQGLAELFGVDPAHVRVQVPYVGGAYGAKNGLKCEPLAAALAALTGRPVRLVLPMEEAFMTVTTHGTSVRMRTAVGDDGRILGRDCVTTLDAGAYAEFSPRICAKIAYRAVGPYRLDAFRSVGRAIYSNRVPAGAYRGFGAQQATWATESAMDEIAMILGRDPVDYRRSQFRSRGEAFLFADGPVLDSDLAGDLGQMAAAPPPGSAATDTAGVAGQLVTGVGYATGVKDGGGVAGRSQARVGLGMDGHVTVWTAAVEFGQGSENMIATLIREVLGCQTENVTVRSPDTDDALYDSGTNSSRSTVFMGGAVQSAARALRMRVSARLVESYGVPAELADSWRLHDAEIVVGDSAPLPVADVVEDLADPAWGLAVETGEVASPRNATALGHTSPFFEVSHARATVGVNRDTGQVHLLGYESVSDAGNIIDPLTAHGQDHGSIAMGIGHTLMERLEFEDGLLLNPNLAQYAVPRARDLAGYPLTSRFIENGDGPGPGGAKGIAEGGIMPVAPAVANAVFAATGLRMRELPLTPERVWSALTAANLEGDCGIDADAGVGVRSLRGDEAVR
jgi:CO/xanthine dehydrogenase Mo-binding subunit